MTRVTNAVDSFQRIARVHELFFVGVLSLVRFFLEQETLFKEARHTILEGL